MGTVEFVDISRVGKRGAVWTYLTVTHVVSWLTEINHLVHAQQFWRLKVTRLMYYRPLLLNFSPEAGAKITWNLRWNWSWNFFPELIYKCSQPPYDTYQLWRFDASQIKGGPSTTFFKMKYKVRQQLTEVCWLKSDNSTTENVLAWLAGKKTCFAQC